MLSDQFFKSRCLHGQPGKLKMVSRNDSTRRSKRGCESCKRVEAVRQWQSKGLRELRKPSMSNELKPFIWDDYVYNQALRGNGAEHFNRTWTSSTERIALEEW